ncbi:helix-turn-helix domain-containing protein [Infirmifilum lucidum]|uniref:Helix-turn-helix domain-containing protein n=1 Tax=Infirmifilum lucidum TaxID=2776706 RepID=A0A7L9FI68_9CREN|nr:MarR family transcriptional regulator [Infirmifilum lucidum]QOJ79341.1 helix-turn-helix domain-containing protein [Infirmifilum lucidum]
MLPVNIPSSILHEAIAVLSGTFAPLNLPKSSSLILALLYTLGRPLDCIEIQQATGYSKSAVSAALRVLESHRLVHRVKRGRRSAYAPSHSLAKLLTEAHVRMLRSAREHLHEISKQIPKLNDNIARLDSELSNAIRILEAGIRGAQSESGFKK